MAVEDGNYLVTIACPGGSPPNSDRFNELVSTLVPPRVATPSASGRPRDPRVPQGQRGFCDAALTARAIFPQASPSAALCAVSIPSRSGP
jgi:hypothetical protein